MRARLFRFWPWALLALAVLGLGLFVDEAVAQSTGGSFGGGSFGGGGGGGSYSGGGGSSSGSDDGGDGIFFFILSILFSRLPWPLKIGLVVVVGGGWVVYKVVKQRRPRGDEPRDHDGP